MSNKDFRLSFKTVWFLVVGHFLFTFFGTLVKLQHWEYADVYLMIGVMLFIPSWFIILIDMMKNKMQNKTLWLIMMFFLPSLTPIIYLIQRDKLVEIS